MLALMTTQLLHSNGARFDVLGSADDGKVWLRRVGGIVADGMAFERDYLELHFTAYPVQKPVGGQLVRSSGQGGRTPFNVVSVSESGTVWMQHEESRKPYPFSREYVQEFFTAYPPQPKPDRVNQLMQETADWVPLTAYRVTFCPADNVALEPGHRVVEAYAGALIDAGKCPVCGRFFSDDTLDEIKIWKD